MLRSNVKLPRTGATESQFDSTIARTLEMLEEQTLDLEASLILDDGLPRVDVLLCNKADCGALWLCPLRAWSEITIHGEDEEPLFHSGAWSPETGHILGQEDVAWEPHCDVISDPDDVVILRTRARRCQWRPDDAVGTGPRAPQGRPG